MVGHPRWTVTQKINQWTRYLVLYPRLGFLFVPFLTYSAEPLPVVLSGEVVFAACMVCHSTQEMQRGPILDGMPAWYLLAQMKKFNTGIRGTKEDNKGESLMAPVAQQYHDPSDLREVAAKFEKRPVARHLRTVRGNPQRGKLLYATCASCHGVEGRGKKSIQSPPLAFLEDWYLMDQLRKFQLGRRGYDPRDTTGKLMQNIAKIYTINDLRDIVAYLAGLNPSQERQAIIPSGNFSEPKGAVAEQTGSGL
jgi:cytochrome c oxidase subunit II